MVTWGVMDTESGEVDRSPVAHEQLLAEVLAQFERQCAVGHREVPRQTDREWYGETSQLVLPGEEPTVTALECDAQYPLSTASELPAGSYLFACRLPAVTSADPLAADERRLYVRFDGPASLRPASDGTVLSLWDTEAVTVGLSEGSDSGPARIAITDTPADLARGIEHMGAAHRTMRPSRSHPELRAHPPLLTVEESLSIPDEVAEANPETGIELRLPPSREALFVAAPLVYYLGADLAVEARETPVLRAAGTDVSRALQPLPGLQRSVARLLQRVFHLDCLVRRVDPGERSRLLGALDIDPAAVRSLTPAGRLERYLSLPDETVRETLPDWHLTTSVRPSAARIRCLPFLLERLSLITLPRSAPLNRSELLDRTLTDAYATRGDAATETVLDPVTQPGHVHAWLAPGTPIDAFKTTPAAFENQFRYRGERTDRMQVTVVLNDPEMADEQDAVTDIYRRRAGALPMDVTVREHLDRAALADVFESENDFVHYIGHCEDGGLCCPDGELAASELDQCRTRTFFLNACGSYDEGLELVEQGSIAGAVTFTDVLDDHAATVGTTFARLLSNGFSIQRALGLARRRIVMGKDYAVVGDGTYALLPNPSLPVVVWLHADDETFRLTCEVVTPSHAGESYELPFDGVGTLNGRRTELTLDRDDLLDALREVQLPVVFEGTFYWSATLADRLNLS